MSVLCDWPRTLNRRRHDPPPHGFLNMMQHKRMIAKEPVVSAGCRVARSFVSFVHPHLTFKATVSS